MKKKYKIADKIIEINSIYSDVHNLCKDYISDGIPDFSVTTSQEDIYFECKKSAEEDKKSGIPIRRFSDGYLETLSVYRKIAEQMLNYDTLLLHGSVVAVDGAGYMFAAKSGTGKSTHTKLWRQLFGERAVMVNDDKPLLKISESGVFAYGTPWNGKHRLSSNISVPLKAICFLTRNAENRIEQIYSAEGYPLLLQHVCRFDDAVKMSKILSLLDRLSHNVSLYKLGCNMEPEAAKIAYNAMKG